VTDGPSGPRTVIVVAKEPLPGRVKTRLCPPCTPAEAAGLAEAALADTLEAVGGTAVDRRVLVLDGRPGPWVPDGFDVLPQRGGPFTERLDAAWLDAVGGRPGPTVQIGMDTPQVTARLLDDALDRLTIVSSLIGPAEDGGWWALGLRGYRPGLFHGVPMSAADTGTRQAQRIQELLGTAPDPLPLLRDVDHIADARRVAALAPGTRFARRLAAIGGR
jgi:glycosyltransferase A (GT-A) superfamily protein (DUF2064 family)